MRFFVTHYYVELQFSSFIYVIVFIVLLTLDSFSCCGAFVCVRFTFCHQHTLKVFHIILKHFCCMKFYLSLKLICSYGMYHVKSNQSKTMGRAHFTIRSCSLFVLFVLFLFLLLLGILSNWLLSDQKFGIRYEWSTQIAHQIFNWKNEATSFQIYQIINLFLQQTTWLHFETI